MRRRTKISLIVQSSFFGAMALMAGPMLLEAKVHAQAAPPTFKQREVKLKDPKVEQEKQKEKNKARSPKAEKPDFAPIEEYYRDFLIPSLTQDAPDQINNARKQIADDIDTIEKNKDLVGKFTTYLVKEMRDLALKGADGKTYSAPARINAANLVGRLSPEPAVLKSILDFVDQKDNDGVVSSGLTSFLKHVKNPQVTEQVRGVFVQRLQVHLTTPAPVTRDPDAQNYLTAQVLECLTEVAKLETDKDKEKGPSKLAIAALTPAVIKIIDEQKSEWLVETALSCFGNIKHANVSAEDAVLLEKAIAKFIKQSIKDWKKRVANSGASAGGGSELTGGGGPSSAGSTGSSMSSGGPAPGGAGKSGGASAGGPGMESGGGLAGGGPAKPKKPFEDQPKEVKNARRIAHQRFEKIHLALNGLPLNPTFQKKPEDKEKAKDKADKALLAWIPATEKETLTKLLDKVDQFQKDLNDEKVTDLSSLSQAVRKSLIALRADCDEILGEKKEAVLEKDEDNFGI